MSKNHAQVLVNAHGSRLQRGFEAGVLWLLLAMLSSPFVSTPVLAADQEIELIFWYGEDPSYYRNNFYKMGLDNPPFVEYGGAVPLGERRAFVDILINRKQNVPSVTIRRIWTDPGFRISLHPSFGCPSQSWGDNLYYADLTFPIVLGSICEVALIPTHDSPGVYSTQVYVEYDVPSEGVFGKVLASPTSTVTRYESLLVTPDEQQLVAPLYGHDYASVSIVNNLLEIPITVTRLDEPSGGVSTLTGQVGDCPVVPFTLQSGEACSKRYVYHPTSPLVETFDLAIHYKSNSFPLLQDSIALTATPLVPQLNLNGWDFGVVSVGSASEAGSVTLESTGEVDLEVTHIAAPSVPDFVLESSTCPPTPFMLVQGNSCVLTYRFSPTSSGPVVGSVNVFSNSALGSPATAALHGIGVLGAYASFNPKSLDFLLPDFVEGQTKNSVLTNIGTESLWVEGFSDPGPHFKRASAGMNPCPETPFALAPGESCSVGVRYQPVSPDPVQQNMVLFAPSNSGEAWLQLSGDVDGVGDEEPSVHWTLSPEVLNLGVVSQGEEAGIGWLAIAAQSETVPQLIVYNVFVSNSPIQKVAGGTCPTPPFSLANGASCTMAFALDSSEVGKFGSLVAVKTSAPDVSTQFASVVGEVVAPPVPGVLSIAPAAVDFGVVVIGEASALASVSLINQGPSTVQVAGVEGLGSPWEIAWGSCGEPPFELLAGSACDVGFRFVPLVYGPAASAPYFVDQFAQQWPVALSGFGELPEPGLVQLSGFPMDFGVVDVGASSAPRTGVVSNIGGTAVEVQSMQLPGAPFHVTANGCPTVPFVLEVGEGCAIALEYRPTQGGSSTDQVVVVSDGAVDVVTGEVLGEGLSGTAVISPDAIDFGAVEVGSLPPVRTLTIQAVDQTLMLHSLTSQSPHLSINSVSCGPLPALLSVGQICEVELQLATAVAVDLSTTVSVMTSANLEAVSVSVSGKVVEQQPLDGGIFKDGFEG